MAGQPQDYPRKSVNLQFRTNCIPTQTVELCPLLNELKFTKEKRKKEGIIPVLEKYSFALNKTYI